LRRIVRALEVHALTGKPISELQTQWGQEGPKHNLDVRLACLNLPRQELYRRIDERVDRMLANGWLEECRALLELKPPLSREASQALGYRTLFGHIQGAMTFKEARDRICFDTHHFARRQLNWFRHIPSVRFVEVAGDENVATIAANVKSLFQ
jgi:tRNA dimethylallyltransferase